MRVVDTSAWIEWLIDAPLADAIGKALPSRERWLVPTVIQLELAKWLGREVGPEKADEVIAFSRKCVVEPLDTQIAIAAAALCRERKLPTADAIVYATALAHDADLLTCDAHFKDLPNVILIEKSA
jgi:predicted nucleic acid-binding protein